MGSDVSGGGRRRDTARGDLLDRRRRAVDAGEDARDRRVQRIEERLGIDAHPQHHRGERRHDRDLARRQVGERLEIGALERSGTIPDPKLPPLTGILLKRSGDILRFRGKGGRSGGYR